MAAAAERESSEQGRWHVGTRARVLTLFTRGTYFNIINAEQSFAFFVFVDGFLHT